ncbi:AAA family ATPase [Amycolatopsis minnesotensis]|uniref:AAA domain-containing protein n=1 Tax=Amycolatopsis minnesotensis TaxID=337894 RepID=A0ABN2SH78_9PSEU
MRATLIATIGPCGAGKTTWRHRHAPAGAEVVSLDEIRAELSPCGCSSDQAVNAAAVEIGTARTRAVLASGGTVVWDTTGYLARFRTHMLGLAAEYHARTVGLVVLPPLLTVLARNGRRDPTVCPRCGFARRVPEHRVWAMHRAITDAVPRLHTEGWHELHFLALPHHLRTHQPRREEIR